MTPRIPSDVVVGQYLQMIALWLVAYVVRPAIAIYAATYVASRFTRKHYARVPVYARYIRRRFT